MAQIKQVGVGRNSTGTIDGINYVIVGGRTIARRLPNMPQTMFNTVSARKRQAIFTMIAWHMKRHRRTIKQTFNRVKYGSATNKYFQINYNALALALDSLADQIVAGDAVSRIDVENAIETFATANPQAIIIGLLDGYTEVYLTGSWPSTITLTTIEGDNTLVVRVLDNANGNTPTTSYTLSVASANAAMGSATGNGTYPAGTTATLTATANSGYHFTEWSDGNTNATRTVTVNANATYTAQFAADTTGGDSGNTGGSDDGGLGV